MPRAMERYAIHEFAKRSPWLEGGEEYQPGRTYTFRCPTCSKAYTYDAPGEPLCTGPSETLDEHAPTVMHLTRIIDLDKVDKNVPADVAAERAVDSLWVPPGAKGSY